ncbi:MAG: hypothetical protein P4L53_24450 [Candidatus Obscuribacterales bacterium]|nr:hypothetical protein [Candidatus Obscuribacterales bacterium]
MTKALEVTIDGKIIGVFVPGAGRAFEVFLGNIPKTYMRVQVISGSDKENWFWQLPDIYEDQVISFRMIETNEKGLPPPRVQLLTQEEKEELELEDEE